jgi:predicted Zn-dependent protease
MTNPLRTTLTARRLVAGVFVLSAFIAGAFASQDFRRRGPAEAGPDTAYKDTDVQAEVRFGREVAGRLLARYKLHENDPLNRYLGLVGKGLALNSARTELEYRFALVESDVVNAYAAPGGYIFVTTAAFRQMQDEAEMAAVLAHEIAHVTQRHVVKALNIRGRDESPEAGLSRLIGGASDATRVALSQALEKAMEILFEKGLQKEDEFDADRLAVLLLAANGYDPMALPRYLERIKSLHGKELKVLSNTHPPFDERLVKLSQTLTAEGIAQVNYPNAKERFQQHVKKK